MAPRSSRTRYKAFVEDYRHQRLDDDSGAPGKKKALESGDKKDKSKQDRRRYIRDYLRWLKPHRYGLAFMFALALVRGAVEMVEPLFMRYIVDHVLLNKLMDDATRFMRL